MLQSAENIVTKCGGFSLLQSEANVVTFCGTSLCYKVEQNCLQRVALGNCYKEGHNIFLGNLNFHKKCIFETSSRYVSLQRVLLKVVSNQIYVKYFHEVVLMYKN